MILERRTRGQPLLALVLILGGWVGARAFAWERALQQVDARLEQLRASAVSLAVTAAPADAPGGARKGRGEGPSGVAHQFAALRAPVWAAAAQPAMVAEPLAPGAPPSPVIAPPSPATPLAPTSAAEARGAAADDSASRRIMVVGGHQSLWLAATAMLPLPAAIQRTAPGVAATAAAPFRRWSADGWLLLRRSDNTILAGPNYGNYGASQVGAVIRYRLSPADSHRTAVYARGYDALNGTREQQAALGLSARPLPALPVAAMAEARLVRDGAGVKVRPAVALVTELPPQRLPLDFVGEAYVQGGWVGGRQPTGFVDGLVRAERPLAQPLDGFSLRAGAGAWGAKQRGASRMDIGPVASLTVRLTDTASARMEADWRFRVAGRSRPDSGPALTISTGF